MSLFFPQLSTGAIAQFPLVKRLLLRTVVNRLPDGSTIRLADPDAKRCRWDLQYEGLSDAERTVLQEFFLATEGRLRPFCFLDPCGNLLAWSEDTEKDVWDVDGLLLTERIEDVLRLTNTAQVASGVRQTVSIPGQIHSCFSASIRSLVPAGVSLSITNSDGSIDHATTARNDWAVVSCSGSIPGEAEDITCEIGIGPGAAVEVRRMQLEAQPFASAYRRTTSRTGIFLETRFDDDLLTFQADGPDQHSTTIRLVSRLRA